MGFKDHWVLVGILIGAPFIAIAIPVSWAPQYPVERNYLVSVIIIVFVLSFSLYIAYVIAHPSQYGLKRVGGPAAELIPGRRIELPPNTPPEIRKMMEDMASSPSMDRWGRPINRSVHETHSRVPPGGCTIVQKRTHEERAAWWDEMERARDSLRDLGDSYVFQMRGDGIDPEVLGIKAWRRTLELRTPEAAGLSPIFQHQEAKGDIVTVNLSLDELVVPARSWADLWDDVLRVHMPKDSEWAHEGPENKVLKPTRREASAPRLPLPDERQLRPRPVIGLQVLDLEDAFEVMVVWSPEVAGEPVYTTGERELRLTLTKTEVKRSPSGEVLHTSETCYVLEMPEPIVPKSSTHSMDGTTMRIRVPKVAPTAPVPMSQDGSGGAVQ